MIEERYFRQLKIIKECMRARWTRVLIDIRVGLTVGTKDKGCRRHCCKGPDHEAATKSLLGDKYETKDMKGIGYIVARVVGVAASVGKMAPQLEIMKVCNPRITRISADGNSRIGEPSDPQSGLGSAGQYPRIVGSIRSVRSPNTDVYALILERTAMVLPT
jgi:hypothetical protein